MTATCVETPTATVEWLATRPLIRLRLDELKALQSRAEYFSHAVTKFESDMTTRAWASTAVEFRDNSEYARWFEARADMFKVMRALDLKREHLKRTVAFYMEAA